MTCARLTELVGRHGADLCEQFNPASESGPVAVHQGPCLGHSAQPIARVTGLFRDHHAASAVSRSSVSSDSDTRAQSTRT